MPGNTQLMRRFGRGVNERHACAGGVASALPELVSASFKRGKNINYWDRHSPESASIFRLESARTGPGRGILLGVISRCYFDSYRSNIEIVADVVTIRRQPFILPSEAAH
jgi:hypothetical protein